LADPADKKSSENAPDKPKPAGWYEGETVTRRTLFGLGSQAFGIAAVSVVALPTVGFALAPIFDNPEERWEGVGHPDDYVPDTYRQAVVTITEEMGDAGKTTVYIRRGSPDLNEDPDEFIAISTRCAHLGCPVRFVRAAGNFICPCHGGVYDFQGQVIGGPPVRPLDRFQTRVVANELQVGPRYSVTSQLEPVRARDPGEYTGGIWEYLYPPRFTTAPPP
jgi:nitrite reductase/ring-hydroxylating ferredoxin subunit